MFSHLAKLIKWLRRICYCASIDHVSVMEPSREFVHFDLWTLKATCTLKFVYHLLVLTILLCYRYSDSIRAYRDTSHNTLSPFQL
jgi:hypothetical protein